MLLFIKSTIVRETIETGNIDGRIQRTNYILTYHKIHPCTIIEGIVKF